MTTSPAPQSNDDFLDASRLQLLRLARGQLTMRLGAEEFGDLSVRRAFPLEMATRYIGFILPNGDEVGLLEDVALLDEDSRQVLEDELDRTYFLPLITAITSIGEEDAVLHADVETTRGPRHLEVRGIRTNIRILSSDRALIQDVEGNRYELREFAKLPKLTRAILGL